MPAHCPPFRVGCPPPPPHTPPARSFSSRAASFKSALQRSWKVRAYGGVEGRWAGESSRFSRRLPPPPPPPPAPPPRARPPQPPAPRPPRPALPPDAPTVPTTHAIHQWNPTVFVVGISVVLVCTWWQWEAGDGESHKDLGGGGAVGAARELPAHCLPFPCGLC